MLRIVTILALIAVVFSSRGRGFGGDIPECQEYLGDGDKMSAGLPNCDKATNDCFINAHKLAGVCVGQMFKERVKAGEGAKACMRERFTDMREWRRLSCKWHSAAEKCMEGKTAETTASPVEDWENLKLPQSGASRCFDEVRQMIERCYDAIGDGCADYKACSGHSPSDDPRLSQWYHVVRAIRKDKDERASAMMAGLEDCIENAQ